MILALTGPTGVGKSALALDLAKRLDLEIVCADAFQVYEGLTIATNAPSAADKALVPHHLFAYVPLSEGYSIHRYQNDCRAALADLAERGKGALLVGGSGLYLRAALYDYDLSLDIGKVDLTPYEALSDEALRAALAKVDPLEASKVPSHARRRLLRALAISLASGQSKSAFLAKQKHQPLYPVRFFALEKERSALYPLVEQRVEGMFAAGLLEETVPLIERYGREAPAFRAIGVKELFPYLDGKASLEATKDLIKLNTRHYLKRQETFFRHQFPLTIIHGEEDLLSALGLQA